MTDLAEQETQGRWTRTTVGWVSTVGWRPSADNARAAYEVLDHIDKHPGSWNQNVYWCGTAGCFAGWRTVLSGETPAESDPAFPGTWQLESGWLIPDRAAQLLGFPDAGAMDEYTGMCVEGTELEGCTLFDGENDRHDLGELVGLIFGPRPAAA